MASSTCRSVGRQSRLALGTSLCKLCSLPLQPRVHASSLAAHAAQVQPDATPPNDIIRTLALRLTHHQLLPRVTVLDTLRAHYPSHPIVCTQQQTGLLKLARAGHATATLDTDAPFYGKRYYRPASTERSEGRLKDSLDLGRWTYKWQGHDLIIYATEYWINEYEKHEDHYIIQLRHPDESTTTPNGGAGNRSGVIDGLIMAAQQHQSKLNEKEIWVFDKGYWRNSGRLWQNVQASRWADVILDEEVKQRLRDDVEGFFDRAAQYAEYAVPWKRGVILHGLPGNGKTISIKALMQSLAARTPPVPTLYVKSMGNSPDKDDVRSVFDKARDNAPCLLVFEDLDSLVSDDVRSFFLNEVDGLEGNDGIMMVGSTNYLDKLDAGISKRPSRFDRKYHFALPSREERERYCETWKARLSRKSSMELPPGFSAAVAGITGRFSFAYMQEAFVSALLSIVQSTDKVKVNHSSASVSDQSLENNVFWKAIQKQVQVLRNEMKDSKKSVEDSEKNSVLSDAQARDASSAGFGLAR